MNKLLLLAFYVLLTNSVAAQNFKTKFEQSLGTETATYQEGITYWRNLANQFDELSFLQIGDTDSGEPLSLIIFNTDVVFDLSNIDKSNKPVILINNAIHAGEPDGVDASMMLIRDFVQNKESYPFLQDIIIAVIPFYNVGGVLNRNSTSRVNQNGPEAYGFRGNARNYDLNRDFIKMDSKNAFAMVKIMQTLDPEVFVETHVTNGSDHQHVLTLISTQHNKLGGDLGKYLENDFEGKIFNALQKKERAPIVYVNVHGRSPNEGWTQFWDAARYSSGYASLFQTLSFMSESHMWKPYQERVENTYDFLESMVRLTSENAATIQEKRMIDRAKILQADSMTINWDVNKEKFRMITLKGYETSNPVNPLTGNPILKYNRDKPIEKEVPFYNEYKIVEKVKVPEFYIVPQAWSQVIERLQTNGVQMKPLKSDSLLKVEVYSIQNYQTTETAYEGHYLHYNTSVKKKVKFMKLKKGDYMIPTAQPAKKFLIAVLEPTAQDSFFNWNFFDTILQQKEGFSDYVFVDQAEAIFKSMSQSEREKFKLLKETDSTFAKSNYAQLDWIYKRSEHYEKSHLTYPIYRLFIYE